MIISFKNIPIYSAATLSEEAERAMVRGLIDEKYFQDPLLQRNLASYASARPAEKDALILSVIKDLWRMSASEELFLVFRDFDTAFALLEKKGHFIHQFEVFLFGLTLLFRLYPLDSHSLITKRIGDKDKAFHAWLLTATAHDFGYPLQVADSLCRKFAELYENINVNKFSEKFRSIAGIVDLDREDDLTKIKVYDVSQKKEYEVDIERFVSEGIQSSLNIKEDDARAIQHTLKQDPNHGYISALILCRKYIDHMSKARIWSLDEENWSTKVLRLAASAIALHALPAEEERIMQKITFNNNPLAYLLVIIDNLQEWARELRPSDQWPSYNLLDFRVTDNSILLSYILTHENWTDSMVADVRESLAKKERILKLPIKPQPLFDFKLSAAFASNHGLDFGSVSLTI